MWTAAAVLLRSLHPSAHLSAIGAARRRVSTVSSAAAREHDEKEAARQPPPPSGRMATAGSQSVTAKGDKSGDDVEFPSFHAPGTDSAASAAGPGGEGSVAGAGASSKGGVGARIDIDVFLHRLHGPPHQGVGPGGDLADVTTPRVLAFDVRSPGEYAKGKGGLPPAHQLP